MSEAKEPEDKKSLSLGARPRRLELKKTVETGQVRQSFSHGRSKAVTVEVRKKRSVASPPGRHLEVVPHAEPAHEPAPPPPAPAPAPPRHAAPAAAPVAPPASAPAPQPTAADVAAREKSAAKGRVVLKQLTEEEKAARARALGDSRKADAEARRRAEQEAKRFAEEEARAAAEREAAGRRAADEEARKKAEEDSRRRAEEEANRRLATEPTAEGAPGRVDGQAAAAEESDEDAERRKRPGAKAPAHRPVGQKLREPRRRTGKLTISRALDEDERVRSLASYRRARERERRHALGLAQEAPKKVIRDVVVPESITVQELANRMAERGVDVIKSLMKMGVMATINQVVDADTAELIVQEFGHRIRRVAEADVEAGLVGAADEDTNLKSRPPVVTIMGHVDHGKTSLLDALRETDVASREAGGITQHIGAYQVTLNSGRRITFLDTPGHEAFTAMRARGAKVTDIVVLVVAADDAVMPQTVEAIRHAKAAGVPLVVAVNKVDKPDANPQKVRQQLLQHEIVVEEMGGDVLAVDVSAKAKTGLDRLEEAILLQAEILDLRSNPDRSAEGVVIEAKLERGRGSVATVLVQRGTLKVGDVFVAGSEWGRVRALVDDRGQNVDEAGPACPVEVLGLQGAPEAGDEFSVVESEARAREVSDFRRRRNRDARAVAGARGTLEQMFSRIKAGEAKELAVVIKTDVQGSLEALVGSASKISTEEVAVRVLHGAVGGINESDVTLAKASAGIIIGFNVRANKQARDLAARDGIDIRYYSVIYNVIDDLKTMLSGMLAPQLRENFLGYAEIREVFNISKVGKVAGCLVTEGAVKRGAKVRLLRDNVVIHEGTLATLKRFKDEVREVKQGTECGMAFENYHDIQVGDVIECFEIEQIARQL
ncbi:MAG TPA: translation initiation factor IF-2 [Candidatus Cybelea sp.]|nr:translation initiation factor IF-2 [Candidatus Cybelea sp.]